MKRASRFRILSVVVFILSALIVLGMFPFGVFAAETENDEYNTVREGIYYVSPDGNDANDGKTLDKAWKSLSFAAFYMGNKGYDVVNTVLVADGTYYESSEIKPNGVIGTKEKPALFKSINKWGAKIISTSPYHGIFICNCQYFTLDGFYLDFPEEKDHHFGIAAFNDSDSKVSNHITIRNCIVTNAPSSGIQINGTDNVIIENNMVFHNALKEDGNNGSGISIYEPKACPESMSADDNEWGVIIRNNYIWQNNCLHPCPGFSYQTDGNGIIIDDYKWSQNGNKYPYTKETLVENNLVFDNGGRGIHVFISDNVTIRNNTVYQNGWTVMQHNAYGNGINLEQGSGHTVVNNAVVTLGSIPSTALNDSCKGTVYRNNVVVGTVKVDGLNGFPTDASISSGNKIVDPAQTDDLRFFNPSVDLVFLNFSPVEGSILLNAGYTKNAPDVDLTGAQRDLSDGVTIGAYETGSENFGIPADFFTHYVSDAGITPFTTPSKYEDKVGNPQPVYDTVKLASDTVVASLFESRHNLDCKSVSIYLSNVPRFNIAVYSDNNGKPGLKLSETGVQTGVTEEKQYTFDLQRTVSVTEGQRIWIALFVEGGADTEICAYGVSSAAYISFIAMSDSAPMTFGNTLSSNMLLSANLNGVPTGNEDENGDGGETDKGGCGNVAAASAFCIAVPVLLCAAVLVMRRRADFRK